MEDTLRELWIGSYVCNYDSVLILILMEDTLRGYWKNIVLVMNPVLILILMEDTLRACCNCG